MSADPGVRYDYLLVQVWVRLSLQYAHFLASDEVVAPLPSPDGALGELLCRDVGSFAFALDPYPFAEDELERPVVASVVHDRRYGSSEDFLGQLLAASQTSSSARLAGRCDGD
ncbi:MAG: hypothetical protein ACYCXY_04010 [Acidimicrobiales bacterium]